MTDHAIESATRADVRALSALNDEVQALHYGWAPTRYRPKAETAAFFEDAQTADDARVLIAKRGRRPVGYALGRLQPREASPFAPALVVGRIEHVAVESRSRERGVGRALVEAVIAELRLMGAAEFDADIRWENGPSRGLFSALGFAPRSVRFGDVA